MDLPTLILCALVAFRLSELIAIDDGPYEIFANARGWFNRAPYDSKGLRRMIADALICVHCVGLWFAFLLAFTVPFQSVVEFLINFLAIAGLQSVIAGKLGRNSL